MKIMLKTLFTKAERFLIRNNRSFVIDSDESDSRHSRNSSKRKLKQDIVNEIQSQRFNDLLD